MKGLKKAMLVIVMALLSSSLLSACGWFKDAELAGYVLEVDESRQVVMVDISDYVNRKYTEYPDIGYAYDAHYDADTRIMRTDETIIGVEELKIGDKVILDAPKPEPRAGGEGRAKQITVVEMEQTEKYRRLTAHRPNVYLTNVVYDPNTTLRNTMEEFNQYTPGIEKEGLNWIEMVPTMSSTTARSSVLKRMR
ncbi:hypothetical protein [Paenibacillus daejeonensis]|uniref:hypothetical protein n=1 Tax=Paenibacillus daejeonensis TaxID=135193 RepID=UPI00036993C0|nr:hypothetical protein [Paenibacillus daejeonensis]